MQQRNGHPRQCSVEGCDRDHSARGYCLKHYTRWKRHGDPGTVLKRWDQGECVAPDCARNALRRGMCDMHYRRWWKHGTLQRPPSRRIARRVDSKGYVYIDAPDHPDVNCDGRVAEHRLVMEREIGRRLLPTEAVHHINGIRDDNRPSNLELWSSAHPPGQRVADKVEWAREMLRLYAPAYLSDKGAA